MNHIEKYAALPPGSAVGPPVLEAGPPVGMNFTPPENMQ